MKRVVFVCALLLLALAGCANQGPSRQQIDGFWQDHSARLNAAKASKGKLAPVYMDSYNRLLAMPDSYDKSVYLRGFAEMTRNASEYDNGKITEDELKIRSMEVSTRSSAESDAIRSANEAERQRRLQQSSIDTANTIRILNALQPQQQAPAMPFPQQKTCDTRYVYGTLRTQCY